jgi:hypothetical protein
LKPENRNELEFYESVAGNPSIEKNETGRINCGYKANQPKKIDLKKY